ncbi:MAG: LytTR family DNA-binding domain-containing protein [Lachnospiraceae bacterium]|nr:LytTR family DNA-binding domain-containing protein [Lachnospiraceae bacterium]
MFLIGICDDEKEQQEYIRQLCTQYLKERNIIYDFIHFNCGEEVVAYSGPQMKLLFLDIEMSGISGIQVVREIENSDKIWRVVFISNHSEAVYDSFGLKTLGFCKKPVDYDRIKKWLMVSLQENQENSTLLFQTSEGDFVIPLEEICFLEGAGNYVKLHGIKGSRLLSGNLKSWEKRLAEFPIIRVHKSFLVNLYTVDKIEKDEVHLCDNRVVPIGRSYKANLRERHREFVFERVRGRVFS